MYSTFIYFFQIPYVPNKSNRTFFQGKNVYTADVHTDIEIKTKLL